MESDEARKWLMDNFESEQANEQEALRQRLKGKLRERLQEVIELRKRRDAELGSEETTLPS